MKKNIRTIVVLLIGLFSIFVVNPMVSSPSNAINKPIIEKLDEKKDTVMKLTAVATSASAAITLIPGDTGTPIAEKLADLSGYFLISLTAIYLEKYILILSDYAVFGFIIPILCVLFIIFQYYQRFNFKALYKRIVPFSLALILVIPMSVKVSDLIETTFDSSMEQTIVEMEETTKEINENSDNAGALEKIWNTITSSVSGATSKITTILNTFIECIAILIVTSCLIPILVLFFFFWLLKITFGVDVNYYKFKHLPHNMTER
ncbi:MAG: hypothetical protein Q4C49_07350 [Bacillota bacterium]|nr:hypothetical protein [Bacillota bacterium]